MLPASGFRLLSFLRRAYALWLQDDSLREILPGLRLFGAGRWRLEYQHVVP